MHKNQVKEYVILITFFFIIIILYSIGKPIPCLFHKITKLYCPGCGITRMFASIFKLNFKEAFNYNQFVFILLVLYIILTIIRLITKKEIKIPSIILYIIIILAIIFCILRNIPYFQVLRP